MAEQEDINNILKDTITLKEEANIDNIDNINNIDIHVKNQSTQSTQSTKSTQSTTQSTQSTQSTQKKDKITLKEEDIINNYNMYVKNKNSSDDNPFYSYFLSLSETSKEFEFDNFVNVESAEDLIPYFKKNKFTLCRIDTEYDDESYCFEFVVENTESYHCGRIYRPNFSTTFTSNSITSYEFYKNELIRSFRRAMHDLGEGISYIYADNEIIPEYIYNTYVYVYEINL